MRVSCSIAAISLLLAGTLGCGEQKTFNGISDVQVRQISAEGLQERTFEGEELNRLKNCLYKSQEIAKDEGKQLLQSTYLIQVIDRNGERSFELYTESNMKGNKGKYYRNNCVYELVR